MIVIIKVIIIIIIVHRERKDRTIISVSVCVCVCDRYSMRTLHMFVLYDTVPSIITAHTCTLVSQTLVLYIHSTWKLLEL